MPTISRVSVVDVGVGVSGEVSGGVGFTYAGIGSVWRQGKQGRGGQELCVGTGIVCRVNMSGDGTFHPETEGILDIQTPGPRTKKHVFGKRVTMYLAENAFRRVSTHKSEEFSKTGLGDISSRGIETPSPTALTH